MVICGRSEIVGKPLAVLLMQRQQGANATVTICHTRTEDLAGHTRRADILVAATGQPNMITADMVKDRRRGHRRWYKPSGRLHAPPRLPAGGRWWTMRPFPKKPRR